MVLAKLKLAALLLAGALAAAGGAYLVGRRDGRAAAEAEQAVAGLQAYVAAVDRAARVLADVREIGRRLTRALEQSRHAERASVITVREVVRENPDFAAMRRPDRLARLRRDELAAIARAAEAD